MQLRNLDTLFVRILLIGAVFLGTLGYYVFSYERQSSNLAWKAFFQEVYWDSARLNAEELEKVLTGNYSEKLFLQHAELISQRNRYVDVFLLREDGTIESTFARAPSRIDPQWSDEIAIRSIREFLRLNGNFGRAITVPIDNEPRAFSVASLTYGDKNGYLFLALRKNFWETPYYSPMGYWYRPWLIIWSATILAFGLVMYLLFTRRIKKISHAVKRITDGHLDQRITLLGRDELNDLAGGINTMAASIQEKIQELKHADELRREMVANISHDLNTPLTSVKGYLSRVLEHKDTVTPEDQLAYISIAHAEANHLGRLINDLLELSKTDAGQIEPKMEDFSLLDVVTEELVPRLQPIAKQQGVTLHVHHPDRLKTAWGDSMLIERMLTNIVENAILYNRPEGEVHIYLSESEDKVQVKIADTGFGIAAEDLQRVFDRFYRGDKSRTRSEDKGGSGLGLAIAKQIIEGHNQELSVTSELNVGTTFYFELPTASSVLGS